MAVPCETTGANRKTVGARVVLMAVNVTRTYEVCFVRGGGGGR